MLSNALSWFQRKAARRMFSRWSPIYEMEVEANAYSAADQVARAAIPYLAQKTNAMIADIGIGTGLLAQQIHDSLPCRVSGLDFTEDMLAVCAGRGITELLIKCDVGKDVWPLQHGVYDAVVSAGLMEYVTKEMLQHFLMQSGSILHKNGRLYFTYIPSETDQTKFWRGHSGTYLICTYSPQSIEQLVKSHGFLLQHHSVPFKGCIFQDGSSYEYRMITAEKP